KNHKTKVARRLIAFGSEKSGLSTETTAKLTEFVEARKEDSGSPIDLSALATKHRLGDIYDTYYRGLSGDAAHPTITSLNRHVVQDKDGWLSGLKWGPDADDVGDTIMAVCGVGMHLLWWAQEAFGSPDNRMEFEACWTTYKSLTDSVADPLATGG
ncbi:MAG TPA: DUF5677 domain-containing protein, partial [Rhizomicrobium sp.]|nr:DUF5677 domain-containing protein [Rhizomicrobium sp.]